MTKSQYITNAILNRGMDLDQATQAWKASAFERENDMYQLVYAFRHQGARSRKEVIEDAARLSGYSVATCGSFYNALAFAYEYNRQEIVAASQARYEAAKQVAEQATEQG